MSLGELGEPDIGVPIFLPLEGEEMEAARARAEAFFGFAAAARAAARVLPETFGRLPVAVLSWNFFAAAWNTALRAAAVCFAVNFFGFFAAVALVVVFAFAFAFAGVLFAGVLAVFVVGFLAAVLAVFLVDVAAFLVAAFVAGFLVAVLATDFFVTAGFLAVAAFLADAAFFTAGVFLAAVVLVVDFLRVVADVVFLVFDTEVAFFVDLVTVFREAEAFVAARLATGFVFGCTFFVAAFDLAGVLLFTAICVVSPFVCRGNHRQYNGSYTP